MKTCTKCGEDKPLSEYHRDKRSKDGRVSICKSCVRVRSREHHARNRDRENDRRRKWSISNKDREAERRHTYRAANPEKFRTYDANYRIRKRGNLTQVDLQQSAEYRKILEGTPCHYCGTTEGTFEIDHKQPVSRGGDDHWTNLVNSCFDCNRSKSSKTYEEFTGTPDLTHYCVR